MKFLGFMWNPLSWVMEAAAIMAIALANGGVSVFFSQIFGSTFCRLIFDYLKLLLFVKYLCRAKLLIGKILWVLSPCLSSIQLLVLLRRTMLVMLLQLLWLVSPRKLRCLI